MKLMHYIKFLIHYCERKICHIKFLRRLPYHRLLPRSHSNCCLPKLIGGTILLTLVIKDNPFFESILQN